MAGQTEEAMLPHLQKKSYEAFYDSARNNTVLDERTTLMVHLAAAMAVGCYP